MSRFLSRFCNLRTKPVKILKISIDARDISIHSLEILSSFIREALLKKYRIETIEFLNKEFAVMNQTGKYFIEDKKCNFDVEISTDMFLDYQKDSINTIVLWSGDSDFSDAILRLLNNGKKVILFATARVISRELNELKKDGLIIFDIRKIKDFICWKREIGLNKSKGDSNNGTPKP